MITQNELANLHSLKESGKELDRFRANLLQRLDQGATVQPGSFGLKIKVITQRLLNAGSLRPILGHEQVQQLRQQVEPCVVRQLVLSVGTLLCCADNNPTENIPLAAKTNHPVLTNEQDVITQSELSDFQGLKESGKALERVRADLMARLVAGVCVEPGPFGIKIKEITQRRLNASSLRPILGHDQVRKLRQQVEPCVVRQLVLSVGPPTL